ncbi:PREDICTED: pentatricopeptide repeat-containing protein At5g11310, mitochondrial [Tarenaya hassleriana]|uniref:pentatricopeptide repeat-containing protein At5g11310, mitochondrial n=1 Tax=Tarenaya hassleriana TaxID=28532 RepID=UPI00053C3E63|nr:PREDICTED: pentatricopeptide repeat-containing protein At5g11310, mitochondrial [Tarenaya hassleriana]
MRCLVSSFRRVLSLNPNHHQLLLQKLFSSSRSRVSIPVNSLIQGPLSPSPPDSRCIPSQQISLSDFAQSDFSTISNILENPNIIPDSNLESALDGTGIEPSNGLVQALFDRFGSSPKLLHSVYRWAEGKPGFQTSSSLFDLVINTLGKARDFESVWSLILDRMGSSGGSELVSANTFVVLIRRYARAGMVKSAIKAFEFARDSDIISTPDSEAKLFEILLDTLCKEGLVRAASEYFEKRRLTEPSWVPSVRIFNILLNGWFRSRKLKKAEKLWSEMKSENMVPTVVTYGTLIEGYCRMRRVEIAIELVEEMKKMGIEPNFIIYNPIIDALGEAGRFKEALSMMERFFICEPGPNISTYNSLVKGFCKGGDLSGASKILKMMTSRGIAPTTTTYNYIFKYYSKHGKTQEGMNLYSKLVDVGCNPDRLTYHLVLKMLCEDGKLSLAMQVNKEMKNRGIDPDLATSTMLIHLLIRLDMFGEAVAEFENSVRQGIVPQYITFKMISDALRSKGMTEMVKKLCDLMSSLSHSKNLPNTYKGVIDTSDKDRRVSILQRAEAMSDVLKGCNNPRKLMKQRGTSKKTACSTNVSASDIGKRD